MDYRDNLSKLQDSWLDTFDKEEWSKVIDFLNKVCYNTTISKNTIKLSKKIYEDTGILVYPVLSRTYASRGMLQNGAFTWVMYDKNCKEVGSIDTVKTCLRKDKRLVVDTSWKDIEIIAEGVDNND